jgi:hypothetical protein
MGAMLGYARKLYVIEAGHRNAREQQINMPLSNEPQRLVAVLGCENNPFWGGDTNDWA